MKNALVIIPFHLPWNWPADFLKQTAHEVSKKNNVVCYLTVEHIRFRDILLFRWKYPVIKRISKRLWIFHPVFLFPFERFSFIWKLNHYANFILLQIICLMFFSYATKKVLWVCDKTQVFLLAVVCKPFLLLYDCVDYVWHPNRMECNKLQMWEDMLIKRSDIMTVNSHILYDLHKHKRSQLDIVPQGFRLGDYAHTPQTNVPIIPKDKPVIGYVGVIDYRFDFHLLKQLIQRNHKWHFLFWGPVIETKMNELMKYPHVSVGSSVSQTDVANIIAHCSVCILPYDTSLDIVKYSFPMKVFEYFYAGKPVVSTDIVELRRYPKYIFISKNVYEWEQHISMLIHRKQEKTLVVSQKRLAEKNSWEHKINSLYKVFHMYA